MTTQPRLFDKTALVVGGGQTPGQTVGNGRATALVFGREGAHVLVADRNLQSAQDTVDEILAAGGQASAVSVEVTDEESIKAMVALAVATLGRIDILHNNVGVSLTGGDAVITEIDMDAFARVTTINLQGMVATCKHVLPIMRAQGAGVIISIGSLASKIDYPYIAYKTSKAGVVAMTENIAIRYAEFGIRANVILPGLMETPMAIESRVGRRGASRDEVIEGRNQHVPLRNKMGTGWDVAHAALFLASDEAAFITGASLPVDGGQSLAVG